ncbi:hypothetical protein [Siphonobacter curvatus]|nr:hypothetical protein [Siphonobacter curvatus]
MRSKEGYTIYLQDFMRNIYVVCPSCHKQAIVQQTSTFRITCFSCGYSKLEKNYRAAGLSSFGGYTLWLTTECHGNELWAYNYEHLAFLRLHVEAKLRERNGVEMSNQTLASRLPRWMLSKKYRQDVLKSIIRLERKR